MFFIHDTTGCQTRYQTDLTTGCIVYTAGCQSVVQPGLTTVLSEQSVRSTRLSNRLSNPFDNRFDNRLDNRFDNRLDVCLHDTAGCKTGCILLSQAVVSCKRGITDSRMLCSFSR